MQAGSIVTIEKNVDRAASALLGAACDEAFARKNYDSPNSGFCPAGTAPEQGCGRARNVKNCTHENYVRNGCAAKRK